MSKRIAVHLCAAVTLVFFSGCASYRVSSNVDGPEAVRSSPSGTPTQPAAPSANNIILAEGDISDRQYEKLGPIEVSVKKLTVFHKDPTKAQANDALIERARAMKADAVINIKYKSGVGFTTWGYIDAKGVAVRFTQ
jgi:hypothetical protein